jgi:serine/threonine protein phosphatase 1
MESRLRCGPGATEISRRIYAIGDIHGCDDRLAKLHDLIRAHLGNHPAARPLLIHIGDYLDRGDRSAAVIARLLRKLPGFDLVNLMGNHERTALDALDGDPGAITDWLHNGGRTALESWGVDPKSPPSGWLPALPPSHVACLRALPVRFQVDNYLFVHAGIRPGIALSEQSEADMMNIRMPFLYSEADFGVVVVHGHTPRQEPEVKSNRIGIDTGAVFGGQLTCAVLEGGAIDFLQV